MGPLEWLWDFYGIPGPLPTAETWSDLVRPPGLEPRNLQIKNLLLYR
jgi:hypothetical protein